jgi:hypothetical protein
MLENKQLGGEMFYDKLSTTSLKDLHDSIRRCIDEDDAMPKDTMKRYGVREYPDWKEHLDKIEAELKNRNQTFTPIDLRPQSAPAKPAPVEWVLYERIKACLAYEDELSLGTEKPYGVRQYSDWRERAEQLERVLDNTGYSYTKILW